MKTEKEKGTEKTVNVSSVKSEEEILREIIVFIGNYFLVELKDPTEIDLHMAQSFAKMTLRLMMQMKNLGMDKEASPIFAIICYMRDLGQGVHKMTYAPETIGGEPFEKFSLSVLGAEMDKAFQAWHLEAFGEVLSTEGAKTVQAWSGVMQDESK